MVVDLAAWDLLSESECIDIARVVNVDGFHFERIERLSQGGVTRHVAFLQHSEGETFALVPGGAIALGYDPARRPRLGEVEETDWTTSMDSIGLPALDQYLSLTMSPARTTVLGALLVEVVAKPITRTPGDFDHSALVRQLARDGFRLLTPDEWEHACSAGTRSLWRWGESCPGDEPAFGKVRFSELARPNAFGLAIAQDPYKWEYTMAALGMRGGDGGEALCGGYGNVATWMPLASSYVWPMLNEESYLDEGFVRRAVPVREHGDGVGAPPV
jgi:hypothetical protein